MVATTEAATKVCKDCGIEKPLSDYYLTQGKYPQPRCKPCANRLRTITDRAANARKKAEAEAEKAARATPPADPATCTHRRLCGDAIIQNEIPDFFATRNPTPAGYELQVCMLCGDEKTVQLYETDRDDKRIERVIAGARESRVVAGAREHEHHTAPLSHGPVRSNGSSLMFMPPPDLDVDLPAPITIEEEEEHVDEKHDDAKVDASRLHEALQKNVVGWENMADAGRLGMYGLAEKVTRTEKALAESEKVRQAQAFELAELKAKIALMEQASGPASEVEPVAEPPWKEQKARLTQEYAASLQAAQEIVRRQEQEISSFRAELARQIEANVELLSERNSTRKEAARLKDANQVQEERHRAEIADLKRDLEVATLRYENIVYQRDNAALMQENIGLRETVRQAVGLLQLK